MSTTINDSAPALPAIKAKFQLRHAVQTQTGIGTVAEIGLFSDHAEYLVSLPNGTASWIHEGMLSAAPTAKPTNTQKT